MLDKLKPPKGAKKARKRLGRGEGTGVGGTAGKGHKGQKSRSGGGVNPRFEGGQMPIYRRLPRRGFTNIFRTEYQIINLGRLQDRFEDGAVVDRDTLVSAGLITKRGGPVKILGNGELSKKLTVKADKFSGSAKAAIEKAGGTAEAAA